MQSAIVDLRHRLHRYPELSGQETGTAQKIKDFLIKHLPPSALISELGGHGLAAVYRFGEGPTVVFRCELDALPIQEKNEFAWRSERPGIAHKCGHDGHMAMVAGVIFRLREQSFTRGTLVLLFQPAEETGQGAAQIYEDPRFVALQPDYVFALHNIPGEALGRVLVMEGGFSAEVISCAITILGKAAHAAEPENGENPAYAIGEILHRMKRYQVENPGAEDFGLLTPVHCRVGEVAYGIAPGEGELHYTLRTWTADKLDQLRGALEETVADICRQSGLSYALHWREHFPASRNDQGANALVAKAAEAAGLPHQVRRIPFKFGEDFGWFSRRYPTAMFGLGAGQRSPALHHADYDFPDELLPKGAAMFAALARLILTE
jgi:amidohydrolase